MLAHISESPPNVLWVRPRATKRQERSPEPLHAHTRPAAARLRHCGHHHGVLNVDGPKEPDAFRRLQPEQRAVKTDSEDGSGQRVPP